MKNLLETETDRELMELRKLLKVRRTSFLPYFFLMKGDISYMHKESTERDFKEKREVDYMMRIINIVGYIYAKATGNPITPEMEEVANTPIGIIESLSITKGGL